MKKINYTFIVMLILVMIGIPVLLIAQPPVDPDVEDVPFDGGVSLLIAAGIGHGLKKAYNKKKAEKL